MVIPGGPPCWLIPIRRQDCDRHITRSVLELQFDGASIEVEFVGKAAVGCLGGAWHCTGCGIPGSHMLAVHGVLGWLIGMRRWAVRTVMVLDTAKGHRTGLDSDVQPGNDQHTQNATRPGPACLSFVCY